jgi:hypothetical protein
MEKDRRKFLAISLCLAADSAFRSSGLAQSAAPALDAKVMIQSESSGEMAPDFTGLSYEMPQLYNPSYFSASNRSLVEAFRRLSSSGVLRLGGNLSDVARWSGPSGDFSTPKQVAGIASGKTYWEWKLTDASVQADKDGAITPEAIANLASFLKATGWRLIYGLNFGCGSPERAAEEASYVVREVGTNLLALQIGNESDFYGGRPLFREKPFTFAQYLSEYRDFMKGVRAKSPGVPFAGPDTASNMGWVDQFAQNMGSDVVLLTSHFYAMGPAKDPSKDAALLLSQSDGLTRQISSARKAVTDSEGLRFRMTEGNSCYGGGKPDVSDAYASALWCADYMLACAVGGYAGVNLHGGGDGYYTPIAVGPGLTAELRPIYFGMQFAQQFAGYTLHACSVKSAANLTAYAGVKGSTQQIALINKGPFPVEVDIRGAQDAMKVTQRLLLTAPSLQAKKGIKLAETDSPAGQTHVAPYTAVILR